MANFDAKVNEIKYKFSNGQDDLIRKVSSIIHENNPKSYISHKDRLISINKIRRTQKSITKAKKAKNPTSSLVIDMDSNKKEETEKLRLYRHLSLPALNSKHDITTLRNLEYNGNERDAVSRNVKNLQNLQYLQNLHNSEISENSENINLKAISLMTRERNRSIKDSIQSVRNFDILKKSKRIIDEKLLIPHHNMEQIEKRIFDYFRDRENFIKLKPEIENKVNVEKETLTYLKIKSLNCKTPLNLSFEQMNSNEISAYFSLNIKAPSKHKFDFNLLNIQPGCKYQIYFNYKNNQSFKEKFIHVMLESTKNVSIIIKYYFGLVFREKQSIPPSVQYQEILTKIKTGNIVNVKQILKFFSKNEIELFELIRQANEIKKNRKLQQRNSLESRLSIKRKSPDICQNDSTNFNINQDISISRNNRRINTRSKKENSRNSESVQNFQNCPDDHIQNPIVENISKKIDHRTKKKQEVKEKKSVLLESKMVKDMIKYHRWDIIKTRVEYNIEIFN